MSLLAVKENDERSFPPSGRNAEKDDDESDGKRRGSGSSVRVPLGVSTPLTQHPTLRSPGQEFLSE